MFFEEICSHMFFIYSTYNFSNWWVVSFHNQMTGCQRGGVHFALILVDNEAVPSVLDIVLCNCKTGYVSRHSVHPKIQWYLVLCVTFGKEVMVKPKGTFMLQICNNHETDLRQVCGNSLSGLGRVEHTKGMQHIKCFCDLGMVVQWDQVPNERCVAHP